MAEMHEERPEGVNAKRLDELCRYMRKRRGRARSGHSSPRRRSGAGAREAEWSSLAKPAILAGRGLLSWKDVRLVVS
jgi:hypothetical protein